MENRSGEGIIGLTYRGTREKKSSKEFKFLNKIFQFYKVFNDSDELEKNTWDIKARLNNDTGYIWMLDVEIHEEEFLNETLIKRILLNSLLRTILLSQAYNISQDFNLLSLCSEFKLKIDE